MLVLKLLGLAAIVCAAPPPRPQPEEGFVWPDAGLVGGVRPLYGAPGTGGLVGGNRPLHDDGLAGGARPPVHGDGDDGGLAGGDRPPVHDDGGDDGDDGTGANGQLAGGHRPPLRPRGHLASGHRPPHDLGEEPGEVVGGNRPPVHGDTGGGDGEPFVPDHGIPPPFDPKYPFLKDVTLEAKHDFYNIVNNPDYTKAEMRLYVDSWARRQGQKLVTEVDAWNEENDNYYAFVRVTLGELLDSVPRVYTQIRDIQDNNHITKGQELEQVMAVFNSLDLLLKDSIRFLIDRVDERRVTSIEGK